MTQTISKQILCFSDYEITVQDVPDEIALTISLSGCPLHCKGCHSQFTWDSKYGEELTDEKFKTLLSKNKHISCVLFYGGEWQIERLLELIKIAKEFNLKTCLYTGLILEEIKQTKQQLLDILDYIKVGRWIQEKGGLNKKNTNQRFYKIIKKEKEKTENVDVNVDVKYKTIDIGDIKLIDWTNKFFKN